MPRCAKRLPPMSSSNKTHNALGLCKRAGKCLLGDFACEKAVKNNIARLLILDVSASKATQERYAGYCERAKIPMLVVEEAGRAVGRPDGRVIAVTDAGFATMIEKAVSHDKLEAGDVPASKR